jgi:ABC-2 type transport system permease protein
MYVVELTPATFFAAKLPRTVTQALFFVFIARAAGGAEMARFALIGNGIHAATFVAVIFMAIQIELEKWTGTLQYLIAAPTHWLPLMVGRSAATFGDTLIASVMVFGVLIPLLQPDITLVNMLRSVPLVLLTVASTSALGWLVGAIALPIRWGLLFSNMVGYVMMVLCGVNFPIDALPPVAQAIGRALPTTHGLLAIRAVIDGVVYSEVARFVRAEAIIGFTYALLAWLMFAYRLRVVRHRGTLELF